MKHRSSNQWYASMAITFPYIAGYFYDDITCNGSIRLVGQGTSMLFCGYVLRPATPSAKVQSYFIMTVLAAYLMLVYTHIHMYTTKCITLLSQGNDGAGELFILVT